jgi:hypothetical protein
MTSTPPLVIGSARGKNIFRHDYNRTLNLRKICEGLKRDFSYGGYLYEGRNKLLQFGEKNDFLLVIQESGGVIFRHQKGDAAALDLFYCVYYQKINELSKPYCRVFFLP